jgi:hypothetical protein
VSDAWLFTCFFFYVEMCIFLCQAACNFQARPKRLVGIGMYSIKKSLLLQEFILKKVNKKTLVCITTYTLPKWLICSSYTSSNQCFVALRDGFRSSYTSSKTPCVQFWKDILIGWLGIQRQNLPSQVSLGL